MSMMGLETELEFILDKRMELFGKYLDRTGMEHKEYQFVGVRWCLKNELCSAPVYGVRGGFIADEMGLGKTIMMIGLMVCNFVKRTLIVLPPMLIDQWVIQIYRTTGHKALVYHGSNKKQITLDMLKKAFIVITSYGDISYRKKINNYEKMRGEKDDLYGGEKDILFRVKWSRIVYDEAHHLRNDKTVLFQRIQMLKSGTQWFVSGTPIQNRIKDFYNLCYILGIPSSSYMNRDGLKTIKQTFILKRTKNEVGIWMPELAKEREVVSWQNCKEMELSDRIHRNMLTCDKKDKLLMMLFAKQSCVMTELLIKHMRLLVKLGVVDNTNDVKEATYSSSKLDKVIEEILQRKGNGCGKLVFCHFHREMDDISRKLRENGMGVAVFDGRITGQLKKRSVLGSRAEVLILQIQTGCEGLNLQENYSEIYFVGPHWNPAVEEQAIARCHRIGQTKPVLVKRFIMGNFEQEEQEQKQDQEQKQEQKQETMDNYIGFIQNKKRGFASEIF